MAPAVTPPFALKLDSIVVGCGGDDPSIAREVLGFPIPLRAVPTQSQVNLRLAADLNWDGVVDGLDAADLSIGYTEGLGYCDMDGDGRIAYRDAFLFSLYWALRDDGGARFDQLIGDR